MVGTVRDTKVISLNLILVTSSELQSQRVTLEGRRAEHIVRVLKSAAGDVLRVGVVDGLMGTGRVEQVSREKVVLEVDCTEEPPQPVPLRLVLGMPRPRVARRVMSAVTSIGVKEIALVGGYRVEKSYWDSPLVTDASLREACLLGLEQARDTRLPRVTKHRRFKPFVEDVLPDLAAGSRRLLCHPGQSDPCPAALDDVLTVAIGPDGGWSDYEVERFQEIGFECIHMGPRILRVETAVYAILGRLLAL